jgi:hypothetical protein
MNRINQFRNLALALGLATAALCGGFGCAGPTGPDTVGQSEDEVRRAHMVGVGGNTPGSAGGGFAENVSAEELKIAKPGISPQSSETDPQGPYPEPWRSTPDGPDDDNDENTSSSSSGGSPHPNNFVPHTK